MIKYNIDMIIYKATNIINNKCYIGQTKQTLERRICQHICKANRDPNTYFLTAIKKYGKEAFKWTILEICMDEEDLNAKEIYYISLYDATNKGYNLTKGGVKCSLSEQTKKKMRKPKPDKTNYKGFQGKHTEETKAKLKASGTLFGSKPPWNKGKTGYKTTPHKVSQETRDKISETLKGNIPWNKDKKGSIPWNKGKTGYKVKPHPVSQETRDKISKTLKERNKNDRIYELLYC